MSPMKKLLFACIAYAVLLIGAVGLARLDVFSGTAALLLALAPLVPGLWVVAAVREFIAGIDELQRKIQLEALAVGMAGTFLVLLAGSLLPLAGLPEPIYALPLAAAAIFWLLGQLLAHRRYR